MQKELNSLYKKYLPKFIETVENKEKVSYPLFINVFDDYFQPENIKIMFIGKETHGWGGKLSDLVEQTIEDSVENVLDEYKLFSFGSYDNYWKSSSFWRFLFSVYRKIQTLSSQNRYSFVANALLSNEGAFVLNELPNDTFIEMELREIKDVCAQLIKKGENIDILTIANVLRKGTNTFEIIDNLAKIVPMKSDVLSANVPKSFVWTNLSKIDLNNTAINDRLLDATFSLSMELLEKEIQILQPDFLFFIGDNPAYWKRFVTHFKSKENQIDSNKDLYKIESSLFPIQTKSYWTIHPQFKTSDRLKNIEIDLINDIIKTK